MPSTHMIHFLHLLIMSWWVALFLILYKYIVTYIMEGDFLCFFFSISFSFFMELTFFFLSLISITTGSENFKLTRKFHCRYTLLVAKYSTYKLFIVCTLFLNESLHTFKAWIESPGIKCHQYQRSSFWNTIHSLCALYCSYLWYKKKKKKITYWSYPFMNYEFWYIMGWECFEFVFCWYLLYWWKITLFYLQNILKPPESVCEGRDRVVPALQAAFPTKRIVKKTKDKADLFSRYEYR